MKFLVRCFSLLSIIEGFLVRSIPLLSFFFSPFLFYFSFSLLESKKEKKKRKIVGLIGIDQIHLPQKLGFVVAD